MIPFQCSQHFLLRLTNTTECTAGCEASGHRNKISKKKTKRPFVQQYKDINYSVCEHVKFSDFGRSWLVNMCLSDLQEDSLSLSLSVYVCAEFISIIGGFRTSVTGTLEPCRYTVPNTDSYRGLVVTR